MHDKALEVNNNIRLDGLDMLKALCVFFVISIHARFPGRYGTYFSALARIAVPIYFMITGFFYPHIRKQNKEMKQLCRILRVGVYSNLLYFAWGGIKNLSGGIKLYIRSSFTVPQIIEFIFLNESPFNVHLWYLGALLYVLLIMNYLYTHFPNHVRKILLYITPTLIILNLVFGNYAGILFHTRIPYIWTRNWLLTGIPYFSLGIILNEKSLMVSKRLYFPVVLIFSVTTLFEARLLWNQNIVATSEHYISTFFLSVIVFLFFLNYQKGARFPCLEDLGRKHSLKMYVLHPIIIDLLVVNNSGLKMIYDYFRPICIFGVTWIVSIVLGKISSRILYQCQKYFIKNSPTIL